MFLFIINYIILFQTPKTYNVAVERESGDDEEEQQSLAASPKKNTEKRTIEYFELDDLTGEITRPDKKGFLVR